MHSQKEVFSNNTSVKHIIIGTVLIAGLAVSAFGEDPVFGLSAGMDIGTGTSSYQLESADSSTVAYSQLDFPGALAQVRGDLFLKWGEDPQFPLARIDVLVAAPLIKSQSAMVDQDWFSDPGYPTIPKTLFSYTESKFDLNGIDLSALFSFELGKNEAFSVSALAGYNFRYKHWDITSLDGWFYDLTTNPFDLYFTSYQGDVATYDLYEHLPSLGLLLSLRPAKSWVIRIGADAVLAIASDIDDHLLRSKRSTASTLGFGGKFSLQSDAYLPLPHATLVFTLGAEGEFYSATGKQEQYWYGSLDSGVSQGTRVTDIAHTIDVKDMRFFVSFGVE